MRNGTNRKIKIFKTLFKNSFKKCLQDNQHVSNIHKLNNQFQILFSEEIRCTCNSVFKCNSNLNIAPQQLYLSYLFCQEKGKIQTA